MGLWMIGLEFAVLIRLLVGIPVFVLYLGIILGLPLATFAAVMQFQEWSSVINLHKQYLDTVCS
ncbi:hypothetical protein SAMN05421863_101285 [Nitrosomonas communis]|uniref:Uncharacterized protein n=1 Tax=Nitrosomonas communis TaxID=44574 RepID=A0A1I4N0E6_9PROT|nr:hypothetical protein SAMN05421863_101285 [Nitrosomonas communis]